MVWRKNTTEEIEELRHFVDAMKRGQTPATGDSLLETLRQIHDRREAPVVGHDHKQLLLERLRRQTRANSGLADEDTVPVLAFAPAASPTSLAVIRGPKIAPRVPTATASPVPQPLTRVGKSSGVYAKSTLTAPSTKNDKRHP